MAIERINPQQLAKPAGYTHLVKASGGTTLYLAGQGPYDASDQLVGPGDHRAQTRKALENVLAALQAGGASWRHVVKATYYIVGVNPDTLRAFRQGLREALGDDVALLPASTLIGVAALFRPEMLIEIDVTAVID